ncbi:MAG: hypothetical protein KGK05_03400 [Xanthomonadaceae bacterium]|nr:hypothetical protein [Xanthomonadaceae bacterium]
MRAAVLLIVFGLLAACQTVPGRSGAANPGGDALPRLDSALAGSYDNHEQVQRTGAAAHAGTALAVPHLREHWQALSRAHGGSLWLWRLETSDAPHPATATWLYLLSANGAGVTLTPYRALDPATAEKASSAPEKFRFVAEQWAELAPCAQTGIWKEDRFIAQADAAACSALLPGLGAAAALLPLRMELDGDMLRTATFADQARGAHASIDARRVRWFTGWAAINGGGPKARAGNNDWHLQKGLRLSSEGGRAELRWRDGAASGWSLQLERKTYAERKQDVLQLNVIDDADGAIVDYAWTNPQATAIGFNLGWLQVGLTQETAPRP